MGIIASKSMWEGLYNRFMGNKEFKMVMVGLDAAGKTTLLYKLKLGEVVHSIPTIGFNVESVKYKNLTLTIWDIGGQDKIRRLWRHYYENNQGIIFVVDSSDIDRFAEARDELHKMLEEDSLRGAPVLIYANKQDLPNALDVSEVAEKLELQKISHNFNHKWYVQSCCAVNGTGIYEGMEWLSKVIQ